LVFKLVKPKNTIISLCGYVSVWAVFLLLFAMIYVNNYRRKTCSGIYLTLTSFYRQELFTSSSFPFPHFPVPRSLDRIVYDTRLQWQKSGQPKQKR